ncbi:MAG: nucleoside transporter C-terminal domain-containing protein [Candidatus Latescibacterota bacterium]|nr:nucleoside transporter C-terminal domain-containing protein [Candidatus Latescibacterota bacterium]
MSTLHSALGYLTLLAIAWLTGRRTRAIPWQTLSVATLLQLLLTGLLLQPAVRTPIFVLIGRLTVLLEKTALKANESLLFGGINSESFTREHGPVLALKIAAILIFIASLSRMLYHYRILPWIIARLSRAMQLLLLGISSAESVGVAANIFLGMTEAPLLIRPYVARLTESELFCLMTGGMATIAGTVMIIYATILGPIHPDIAGHLFVASLISAPAAIAVAKLMIPETDQPETAQAQVELPREDTVNGLDAAARGAAEGMHLVLNVLAMLIAFIGLVALLNYGIAWLDGLVNGVASGWSLEATAGVFFHPLVWLMGIPWAEAGLVGELMGLKTILNEFVAYLALSQHMGDAAALSQRSFIIATYALCGFANFGSVAIMIGGIGGIAPERRGDLARLGLRSLVGGTLATMLTGCVIGLYL